MGGIVVFEILKDMYRKEKITAEQLDVAITKGWITEQQKAEILG